MLHERPAAFALSTASSISAWVDWGTLVTTCKWQQCWNSLVYHSTQSGNKVGVIYISIPPTWLVAGLCTSIHWSVELSNHWPPTTFWVVGGTCNPNNVDWVDCWQQSQSSIGQQDLAPCIAESTRASNGKLPRRGEGKHLA